jgi:hypothetical protein
LLHRNRKRRYSELRVKTLTVVVQPDDPRESQIRTLLLHEFPCLCEIDFRKDRMAVIPRAVLLTKASVKNELFLMNQTLIRYFGP